MYFQRHPIYQWVEGIHHIFNIRRPEFSILPNGCIQLFALAVDDGPATRKKRYDTLPVTATFRAGATKEDVQTTLWQTLNSLRDLCISEGLMH